MSAVPLQDTFEQRMKAIVANARARAAARETGERAVASLRADVERWVATSQGVALLLGALHRAGWERDEAYCVCGPAFDALANASSAALLGCVDDVRYFVRCAEVAYEAARRAVGTDVEKGLLT